MVFSEGKGVFKDMGKSWCIGHLWQQGSNPPFSGINSADNSIISVFWEASRDFSWINRTVFLRGNNRQKKRLHMYI